MKSMESMLSDLIYNIYQQYKNGGNKIRFDINKNIEMIKETIKLLQKTPTILHLDISLENIVIVGDIHGNLESLFDIFQQKGFPETTNYLFLGDYVDRGENSCEVISLLYAYKCLYPNKVNLIRGNHEFRDMNESYGFKTECLQRIEKGKNLEFFDLITYSFKYLPIAAILSDKITGKDIFCVHGGISALINSRDELLSLKKVGDNYCSEDSVQAEFLWNDPDNSIDAYQQSDRGIGCLFGKDALDYFLKSMNFQCVIRAHQREDLGFNWPIDDRILTIFSSHDYCGTGNEAAVATIIRDDTNESNVCNIDIINHNHGSKGVFLPTSLFENIISPLSFNGNDLMKNVEIPISA